MMFRRQDIPKTTRSRKDGAGRRLYPRYLRDQAMLPRVELAIDYLDGMVGKRRGELSADNLIELFGDPKLARCLLACMAETYRYRERTFADELGDETSARLAVFGLTSPAELRGFLYLAANATHDGFVAPSDRDDFLSERANALGLDPGRLAPLIHLDAERNAELVRIGNRPAAADITARYNVVLVLSVLRHASLVDITLPGLPVMDAVAICDRHAIEATWIESGLLRLRGRRNAVGVWSGHGGRVARCALHLLMRCPRTPALEARVHFGEQTLHFELDGPSLKSVRPSLRAAADVVGIGQAADLAEAIGQLRKQQEALPGWTVRRMPDPIIVEGAIALPEISLNSGGRSVGVVPVPASSDGIAALGRVARQQPVIALSEHAIDSAVPSVNPGEDVSQFAALLDALAPAPAADAALTRLRDVLATAGWVTQEMSAGSTGAQLLAQSEAVSIPGAGLFASSVIDGLTAGLRAGPVDIRALRGAALQVTGDAAVADAVTLHLLDELDASVAIDREAARAA